MTTLTSRVYEERDRLLDAINEAEARARARMLQLRGRVMNNDFDIDASMHRQYLHCAMSTSFCTLFRSALHSRQNLKCGFT